MGQTTGRITQPPGKQNAAPTATPKRRSPAATPQHPAAARPKSIPHQIKPTRPEHTTRTARPEAEQSQAATRAPAEMNGTASQRLHSLPYQQFHVLLNSLFKVLCNFPSRYLFAIGYVPIFSLRWGLPPALGCTFKQPYSRTRHSAESTSLMGLAPFLELCS